jgi:hypothetical protein
MRSRTPDALAAVISEDATEVRVWHWGNLVASLSKKDGRFVMFSPLTGEQSRDAAHTDMKRLTAHWRGFLNAQRGRLA